MYAIVGASGNSGSVVAETLLAGGEKVRVIGRDPRHLAHLTSKGAQALTADVTDAGALAKAFEGATGVYALLPPNIGAADVRAYQERAAEALVSAIQKASVRKVVLLSSVGADKSSKVGPVVGLYNFEQKLNGIKGLNAIYLRAGYFMENLLPQISVIQNFGFIGGPVRPDLSLPLIATRDIGSTAAELLKSDFTGKQTRELLGQRNLNYTEAASIIGKAIGQPDLTYKQMPPQQIKPALTQMGMSPGMADLLLEMAEALNSGHMAPLETRSPRNTTATSFEEFVAEVFVPRFQGKATHA